MSARPTRAGVWLTATIGSVALLGAVVRVLLGVADQPAGLTQEVRERLVDSGVEHPVTAVLLIFRAYDTWLEVVVLLAAAVGAVALRGAVTEEERPEPPGAVVRGLAEALLPVTVVIGIFVLSLGAHSSGGAFQGGAVLAAGLVLLHLGGYRVLAGMGERLLWTGLLAGTVAFAVAAAVPLLVGEHLLEVPLWRAHATITALELAVAASVAVTLAFLYSTASPVRR